MKRDQKEPTTLRLELIPPPLALSPLFTAAHQTPHAIDALLAPHLLHPSLPTTLAYMLDSAITGCVTPPLYWGGDPRVPQTTYLNCAVHATMAGRAFALLSAPSVLPRGKSVDDVLAAAAALPTELKLHIHAQFQEYHAQRRRVWQEALTPVFIKALMSGCDPAPGARFAAAILFLTCWTALAAARPPIKGRGTDYVWFMGSFKDAVWDLDALKKALMDTRDLPRENWDVKALEERMKRGQGVPVPEYVPLECVEMLDAARTHVSEGGTDWPLRDYTSSEVVTLAFEVLERANGGAEMNPDECFVLAMKEWQSDLSGKWVPGKKTKPEKKNKRGKK